MDITLIDYQMWKIYQFIFLGLMLIEIIQLYNDLSYKIQCCIFYYVYFSFRNKSVKENFDYMVLRYTSRSF